MAEENLSKENVLKLTNACLSKALWHILKDKQAVLIELENDYKGRYIVSHDNGIRIMDDDPKCKHPSGTVVILTDEKDEEKSTKEN